MAAAVISYRGLKPLPTIKSAAITAELNPSLMISLSTALPREVRLLQLLAKQGLPLPEQDGKTHLECVNLLKCNNLVGFNVVDMSSRSAKVVAYYKLDTASNGYDPNFFG